MTRATIRIAFTFAAMIAIGGTAAAAIEITTTPHPGWTQNHEFHQTLAARGGEGELHWSFIAGELPTGLDLSAAGVLSGMPVEARDFHFTIRVSDENEESTEANCLLVVNPAMFVSPVVPTPATAGASYFWAFDCSGGTGEKTWSIQDGSLPAGLELQWDGRIMGEPEETGTFNFTVRTEDAIHASAIETFDLTVNARPSLSGLSPAAWTALRPYEARVKIQGGTAPFTWTVGEPDGEPKGGSGADLPKGIGFDPLGAAAVFSGIPEETGSFAIPVTIEDRYGATATAEYELVIASWPAITTTSLPIGMAGMPWSATVEAEDGTGPYHFSVASGEMPGGVAFHQDGGIAGVPLEAGSFEVEIELVDAAGGSVSATYTIEIAEELAIADAALPEWTSGEGFPTYAFQADGGTGDPVWSPAASLPAGLSLDSEGTLSGTPKDPGDYVISLVAHDPTGFVAQAEFPFHVNPRPTLATGSVPSWTVNRAYEAGFAADGGTAPLTWRIASGRVPHGVALESEDHTARLSGVPSESGTFLFTVEIADRVGATIEREYVLDLRAAPIVNEVRDEWTAQSFYRSRIGSVGTTAPLTWSVVDGELPPGLLLLGGGAQGEVTGTPQAAGEWAFSVVFADDVGTLERWNYVLTLNEPVGVSEGIPLLASGRGIDVALGATGGTAPFDWLVTNGRLPDGLTLDPATGHLAGTPGEIGSFPVEFGTVDATGGMGVVAGDLHVAAPLDPNGRTDAEIVTSDLLRHWFVEAGEGSKVTLDVRMTGEGGMPDARLLDADGEVYPLAKSSKGYRLRNWVVPRTGRYFLEVDNGEAAFDGSIRMKSRVRPVGRLKAAGTLDAPDYEDVVPFAAPAESKLDIDILTSQSVLPDGLELEAPDGHRMLLAGLAKINRKGRKLSVRRLPLAASGEYRLILGLGAAGDYRVKIKVKTTKKSEFVLP